jgi:predicted amidohydrolase
VTTDGRVVPSRDEHPTLNVGFYQFSPVRGDPERNRARLAAALRSTPVDLLVCPELSTTGYLFLDRGDLLAVAEPVPEGPTCAALSAACRETGSSIVFGIAERAADGLFNSAVLLTPDGGAVCYRKAHLFDTELLVFDRAGSSPRIGTVKGAKVGIMVCFDWRFPEMARALALEGADVIAHPANLVHPHCQDAMVTRSLENRVFSVTASRTGVEEVGGIRVAFTGRSQILSPMGARLAQAGPTEECVQTSTVNLAEARDKRVTSRNDLFKDRRPELYGSALESTRRAAR